MSNKSCDFIIEKIDVAQGHALEAIAMRLHKSDHRKAETIFTALEKARLTLSLNHVQWADTIALSLDDYRTYYLEGRCKSIPYVSLYSVSAAIDISAEVLVNDPGRLDYKAIFEHYRGNKDYIPERYTIAATSVRRTSNSMLSYVEKYMGLEHRFAILRELQVTPAIFHNLSELINIRFSQDLLHSIAKKKADLSFFRTMGADAITKTVDLDFTRPLRRARSITELYEHYFQDTIKIIEKNTIYRIVSLGNTFAIIEAIQNPEVVEALKDPRYGSKQICTFKTGGLSRIPAYLGLPDVHAVKIKCIHDGDSACQWMVQFPSQNLMRPSSHEHLHAVQ